MKSQETIRLKDLTASYDEYIAMIKGRKAQGLSVELTGSGIRDAVDVFPIMSPCA